MRRTLLLVSDTTGRRPWSDDSANGVLLPGLQTPRLKRLAEIVSAQAIAQQEKLDDDDEYEGEGDLVEDVEGEAIAA